MRFAAPRARGARCQWRSGNAPPPLTRAGERPTWTRAGRSAGCGLRRSPHPCTRCAATWGLHRASGGRVPSSGSPAFHPVHPPLGCELRTARRGKLPRSQSRAALRWDFAAPGAANFHEAGLCGAGLGLCRARRGELPWRRAVLRCVWNFAAPPPGGRDALHARTRAEGRALLRQGAVTVGAVAAGAVPAGGVPVGAVPAGPARARRQWRSKMFNRR